MIKNVILTIVTMLAVLCIIQANATCPCWKNLYLCPCTRDISKLLFIQNNAYAFSANEGLLKSEDEGRTWTALREGLHWQDLKMIGLVGNEMSHFILATGDKPELYEWQPTESKWRKIKTEGLPDKGRLTCFLQNTNGILYLSLDDTIQSNHNAGGVYQSFDFGVHWVRLKFTDIAIDNNHRDIIDTQIVLDSKNNLYAKGKAVFSLDNTNDEKSFVYLLPADKTQWIDTHYSASDILILNNELLGLITDNHTLTIKQLKMDEHLEEKKSWSFHFPDDNIKPIIINDQNTLYMIENSNLYQLMNINDPESTWTWVKNSDANMPTIRCLAIHNHQLFAAGGRFNQSQSSIDIFPLN